MINYTFFCSHPLQHFVTFLLKQHRKFCRDGNKSFLILFLIIFKLTLNVEAQSSDYTQLWNEIQFLRPFNDKWSSEIILGGKFSNTPTDNKLLHTNIQRTARVWAHYYYSSRWKFSSFIAYYYNKDVPDIGQYKANEWRFAMQGMYYFHKLGYTLNTHGRVELRFIQNENGAYEDNYRYRQQIKFVKPINSQVMRQGIFYILASEELSLRSKSKTTGLKHLDRNTFTAGAGYLITDDLQVELAYTNEYLPRDDGNQVVNAVTVTVSFNNFLPNLKKKIAIKQDDTDQGD
jgi:hypothetical protein